MLPWLQWVSCGLQPESHLFSLQLFTFWQSVTVRSMPKWLWVAVYSWMYRQLSLDYMMLEKPSKRDDSQAKFWSSNALYDFQADLLTIIHNGHGQKKKQLSTAVPQPNCSQLSQDQFITHQYYNLVSKEMKQNNIFDVCHFCLKDKLSDQSIIKIFAG